jgi:lipoprotein-anchoring transpeptidase ErfK/SrfK
MRALLALAAAAACVVPLVPRAAATASPESFVLVVERGTKVAIRRTPGSRTLAVAGWKTPFGSVRRLRVAERRGDWFAVESDVLGNGITGWVPRTASVRVRRMRFSVEADLSQHLLTLRRGDRIVFRRRVSIGAAASPTPTGRFHVTDQISGRRWRLGCCIVVLSGTQPRLPDGWSGGDRLAIHGRPGRSPIGRPTSAGCLHATEQTLRVLATLPLGTPVVIHP